MINDNSIVSYVFTKNQLKVLLVGCGYSKITGINLGDEIINNEEVLNSLNELVNKNVISSDGDIFKIEDNVHSIIMQLGEAKEYVAVHCRETNLPCLCCYPGNRILVCNEDECNRDVIKFALLDATELIDKLDSEGYFPYDEDDCILNEKELEDFEKNKLESLNAEKPINESSRTILNIQQSNNINKSILWLRITEYSLYNYIAFEEKNSIERKIYSKSIFSEYFLKFFTEIII